MNRLPENLLKSILLKSKILLNRAFILLLGVIVCYSNNLTALAKEDQFQLVDKLKPIPWFKSFGSANTELSSIYHSIASDLSFQSALMITLLILSILSILSLRRSLTSQVFLSLLLLQIVLLGNKIEGTLTPQLILANERSRIEELARSKLLQTQTLAATMSESFAMQLGELKQSLQFRLNQLQSPIEIEAYLKEIQDSNGFEVSLFDGNEIIRFTENQREEQREKQLTMFLRVFYPMIKDQVLQDKDSVSITEEKLMEKLKVIKEVVQSVFQDLRILHTFINNPNRLFELDLQRTSSSGYVRRSFWTTLSVDDGNKFYLVLGTIRSRQFYSTLNNQLQSLFGRETREILKFGLYDGKGSRVAVSDKKTGLEQAFEHYCQNIEKSHSRENLNLVQLNGIHYWISSQHFLPLKGHALHMMISSRESKQLIQEWSSRSISLWLCLCLGTPLVSVLFTLFFTRSQRLLKSLLLKPDTQSDIATMGDYSTPIQLVINIERNLAKRKFLQELVVTDERFQAWISRGFRFFIEVSSECNQETMRELLQKEVLVSIPGEETSKLYLSSASDKVLGRELSRLNELNFKVYRLEEKAYLRLTQIDLSGSLS